MLYVPFIRPGFVERLKRDAKALHREAGIPHHEALDRVARDVAKLPDWHHVIEEAKATEIAVEAFSNGVIVGMDVKDADRASRRALKHFIQDDHLQVPAQEELWKLHPPANEREEEWHWTLFYDTVFYRLLHSVPLHMEEALGYCRDDFFFLPQYLRFKGKLEFDFLEGDEEEEAEDE